MSLQKRRRLSPPPSPEQPHYLTLPSTSASAVETNAHQHLHLVTHEASLIRGHEALAARCESTPEELEGGRMLRWEGEAGERTRGRSVWVDRYDALNLLSSLPAHLLGALPSSSSHLASSIPTTTNHQPQSEADEDTRGFSDLDSDSEEMFYFPPSEREEIRRKKKRRMMERGREERMAALQSAEEVAPVDSTEPDEKQLALMHKLHSTLSSASDPKMLEIRILANHGQDGRFDFLRRGGRWSEVWEGIRAGRIGIDGEVKEEAKEEGKRDEGRGGGGLVAYGSDSDEEEEPTPAPAPAPPPSTTAEPVSAPTEQTTEDDRAKREAKAEKVREWARRRKEAREAEEREREGGGLKVGKEGTRAD